MQKIALYGGSFNPIHNGHLIVAEEIRQFFCLHKVIFMPAYQSPHKIGRPALDSVHRMEMIKLAIADNPYFSLSDIEVQRGGVSYTIDTLQAFYRQVKQKTLLYFIIGSDAFLELDTWKKPYELFDYANFIVIERPGASSKSAIKFLHDFNPVPYQLLKAPVLTCPQTASPETEAVKVYFTQATLANISASAVRDLVRVGKSLRYLVPDKVIDYIETQGLYCK